MVLQTEAVMELCPHLVDAIRAGRLEVEGTRKEVWEAYWQRLMSAVELLERAEKPNNQ